MTEIASPLSLPPLPPSNDRYPRVGDWNHLEACLGQRGQGKSTYQCARAMELSRIARGAYVIGHSLGARLPNRLPSELGGDILPVTYHPTIKKLETGLARHPERWHILSPPLPGDGYKMDHPPETADDLLRYAIRLSSVLRKRCWNREHPLSIWKPTVDYTGLECPPIIIIIDEGIAVESAATGGKGRSEDNRWFLQMLYSLRHLHIALLYAIQDPTARSWRVLEQATAIHVFHVRHAWALNAIQAAGASEQQIEEIEALKPYQRVTIT